MRYRLDDPFVPQFREVCEILKSYSGTCFKVYFLMLHYFHIEEDSEADDVWVVGRIRALRPEVAEAVGVDYTWLRRRIWPDLVESGLVVDEAPGIIRLPKYKKKKDAYLIPDQVKRQISALIAEVENLKTAVFDNDDSEEKASPGGSKALSERVKSPLREGEKPSENADLILLKGLKKEKISLSIDKIVSIFYKGIGQKRISKDKRERGKRLLKKLRKEGFSLEDIAFAVEWTLENAKEDLYDLKIIEHTIGQAIAAREKVESERRVIAERNKGVEEERADRDREEKEREEIESQKAELDPAERVALRDEAEAELLAAGVQPGFMNDLVIGFKENEILRKRLEEER